MGHHIGSMSISRFCKDRVLQSPLPRTSSVEPKATANSTGATGAEAAAVLVPGRPGRLPWHRERVAPATPGDTQELQTPLLSCWLFLGRTTPNSQAPEEPTRGCPQTNLCPHHLNMAETEWRFNPWSPLPTAPGGHTMGHLTRGEAGSYSPLTAELRAARPAAMCWTRP